MTFIADIQAGTTVSQTVKTGQGPLHVVDTGGQAGGQHDTIVLWPSIFTDHRIYDGLVEHLGHMFRFLLIDGPAHGLSKGSENEFTMEACGDAMAKVMDHFDVSCAVVGGTSWGGLAAAHLALTQPERASALVLLNTPMEMGATRPSAKARFIAIGARWMLKSAVFRNGVAKSFFSPEVLRTNTSYARAFHDMLIGANPQRLAAAVRSVILRGSPLLDRMNELSMPTLVVAGKQDEMYPINVQAKAAALVAHGHFAPVDGKHISVIERPKQVAEILSKFLTKEVSQ